MKTVSSGHHKVKRGWKLLAGLPKKRGRGSATTRRRKPSPASRSNCACNRPQKATLIRTGTERHFALTAFSEVRRRRLNPSSVGDHLYMGRERGPT